MVKLRTISGIKDIERVSHLSASVFRENNYESGYKWFKDLFLHCPYMRTDLCWVVEVDGEIVSEVQIIDYTMHIGSSTVRMGGLASVLTDPEHRLKGYAAIVLKKSVKFMYEAGFDMSVLYGIGDFYEQFGYVPAMPDSELTIDVSDVIGEQVDGFREMEEDDINQILKFYHRSNECRTGAILRPQDVWKWMYNKPPLFLVKDDGYLGLKFSDNAVELFEVAGVDEQFYDAAIRELAAMARLKDLEVIKAFVPADHPFVSVAVKHGAKLDISYERTGDCMARIIDINSFFEKIQPELEERIKRSEFNNTTIRLLIKSDVGEIEMTLNETDSEKIDLSLELPQTAITQLVLGYKPSQTILFENELALDQISAKVLETLFPQGYPYVWRANRF